MTEVQATLFLAGSILMGLGVIVIPNYVVQNVNEVQVIPLYFQSILLPLLV